MLIGYARVSTQDQTLHLQKDALEKIGCSKIFTDTISGAATEQTGLDKALSYVREGDTLVVWKLDRFLRKSTVPLTSSPEKKGRPPQHSVGGHECALPA